ncbi:MAG: DUF7305 domain-containing protein [Armatimonadota bacterium]
MTCRRPGLGDERGNTMVMVVVLMVAAGVLTVAVLNNLLGEIQGAFSFRHAVQALGAAEAGVHYAAAEINGTGGPAYTGETDRVMTHPTLGTIGIFDVAVRCFDNSVPANPSPCSTSPQPNTRTITATGYVPNKTTTSGRRTVVATVRQQTLTNLDYAVCGMDGVTLDAGTTTAGNVGSNQNIGLFGPSGIPGGMARIIVTATQPGNATAGGTVTCSQSCGAPQWQVAGTTTNSFPGGQVCPVLPPFTASPGTSDVTMGANSTLTISVANGNTALRDVNLGRDSNLIFATTSATENLVVHMNTLIIGRNSYVRVTGAGRVSLYMAGRMQLDQGTRYGIDASGNDIDPGRLTVYSTSGDIGTDYAVEFHQTGRINGIFVAPNGRVQLDRAANSQGAILARLVQFDQNTIFTVNTTGLLISGGSFNILTAWREQP